MFSDFFVAPSPTPLKQGLQPKGNGVQKKANQAKLSFACSLLHVCFLRKGDPEIVMPAVSFNGHALQFAAQELKGDSKIVMAAVFNDDFALQHATEELKGDPGQGAPTIAWSGN